MTPFVKALRLKGWSAQQVAKRWGVSPRRISQIGNAPSQKDWDALEGLPDTSRVEVNTMTEQDWIRKQGPCCICGDSPVLADNMDNVYCEDCADRDKEEDPEAWE